MSSTALGEDRRYCRETLPRVSRTFALNIRLLPGEFRDTVSIAYLLCRISDALEDTLAGSAAEVRERFELLRAAIAGDGSAAGRLASAAEREAGGRDDVDLVAHLPRVLAAYEGLDGPDRAAVAECLEVMTAGMCRYAARAAERGERAPYLDDPGELHDYCWVVAGAVGVMLTRLFEKRVPSADPAGIARRFALAPVVGEALQLTNILLDWPQDVRRGRCFVPARWLEEFGLAPAQLVGEERPGVRALAERIETLARAALARVPDYLAEIPRAELRYRLFVLWPALWAERSLGIAMADARFPWGERRPKLSRRALWSTALGALFAGEARGRLAAGARATA